MKIAVVGSGISGLVAAYQLSKDHQIVLFEKEDRLGGHTHTVEVETESGRHRVDTGFIVYNTHHYREFSRLMTSLGVESQPSQMSFSVRDEETGLEYSGTSLNTLFAQRRNLFSRSFHRMVRDILRFYRESRELLDETSYNKTLGQYLREKSFSKEFIEWHILPMGSAIWSTGRRGIIDFPAAFFVQFFEHHGFLNVNRRPQWHTIRNGSSSYLPPLVRPFREGIRLKNPVEKIVRSNNEVRVFSTGAPAESFDAVVLACHSDQALQLLETPTRAESEILKSIRYQPNEVILHTDSSLLPRVRRARASWNYHLPMTDRNLPRVTYYMNKLQSLRSREDFCVTLNRSEAIDPAKVIASFVYDHPVYSIETLEAQQRKEEISGKNRTYYCGAYWGYGFHEDGVRSGLEVSSMLRERRKVA